MYSYLSIFLWFLSAMHLNELRAGIPNVLNYINTHMFFCIYICICTSMCCATAFPRAPFRSSLCCKLCFATFPCHFHASLHSTSLHIPHRTAQSFHARTSSFSTQCCVSKLNGNCLYFCLIFA